VLFNASYAQTQLVANFNDAPFDKVFRLLERRKYFQHKVSKYGTNANLYDIGKTLKNGGLLDPFLKIANFCKLSIEDIFHNIRSRYKVSSKKTELNAYIHNDVKPIQSSDLPQNCKSAVQRCFQNTDHPCAVIVDKEGQVMSVGYSDNNLERDGINLYERTAIASAIHQAADKLRNEHGAFESWNLQGATLYVNFEQIGPLGYAETLWSNFNTIFVITDYVNKYIEIAARECPILPNISLFSLACHDYDHPIYL
jgi:tRNA(Arg) A34 adenosine deaminase TadA